MIISAPKSNDKKARNDTIPASQPFNLFLLNHISPIAKNKKIIPAKEIYILSIETDIQSPQIPK